MREKLGLNSIQQVLGYLILATWIIIFASGLLINSQPYRDIVTSHSYFKIDTELSTTQNINGPNIFAAWLLVLFCYTPTNVLFLCMASGILGSISRIAILHVKREGEPEIPSDKTNPLISGLFRGMFVYLLIVSGVLIINEAPFTNPTQIQYARLAGFMSLLSFILSYDPRRFHKLLSSGFERIEEKIQKVNK